MEHIRNFPGCLCGIALDGVSQRIHTSCGGQSLWHGGHHIRVNNGNCRDIVGIHTDELPLFFHIGNDIVDGNFCGSAGCCGNSNGGNSVVLCRRNALQRTHIRKFRIGNDNADRLCGIHRRAAADGNNGIRSARLKSRYTLLHILDGGIGLDLRVNRVCNAGVVQNICHLCRHTEFQQIRVCCNKQVLIAVSFYFVDDFLNRTFSMIRNVVQYNTICHNSCTSR